MPCVFALRICLLSPPFYRSSTFPHNTTRTTKDELSTVCSILYYTHVGTHIARAPVVVSRPQMKPTMLNLNERHVCRWGGALQKFWSIVFFDEMQQVILSSHPVQNVHSCTLSQFGRFSTYCFGIDFHFSSPRSVWGKVHCIKETLSG